MNEKQKARELQLQDIRARLPELLNNAAKEINTVLPGSTVMLFGSYARGDFNDDSDIDLCVLVPEYTQKRMDMIVDASLAAHEHVSMPTDLLLYTYDEFEESAKKKSRIHYHIKNEGVVLNGR